MRVTSNTFPNTLVHQLKDLTVRQARLQEQAATGQRIVVPSDDPSAMRRVLDLQVEAKSLQQYRKNISAMTEKSAVAYGVINGMKNIATRASEIGTGADGLSSPVELEVLSVEVGQLLQQAVDLANTQHRGVSIFGGTITDQKPFAVTMDANGAVGAVTYSGNADVPKVEIAKGVAFTVGHPGENESGTGPRGLLKDSRTGADLFAHLISLQNNLQSGDTDAIKDTDLANLLADEDHIILHMAENGALRKRLEETTNLAGQRIESLERGVSADTDADLAQTMVLFNQTQNAYRAALQTAGTILNQSLLDYLR
jgi:flagellar hook-associated protein 3 FlgL